MWAAKQRDPRTFSCENHMWVSIELSIPFYDFN